MLGSIGALASPALAQGQATIDRFAARGPSEVDVIAVSGYTLFVPRNRTGTEPIVTWANGTNATPPAYNTLLTNFASHGLFVVASNSTQTGTGVEVGQGIDVALAMTTNDLVCSAGHSQGGSGAINASKDTRVDCVLSIEPDNRFTASANGSVLAGRLSLIMCGTADTLAPCGTAGATRNGSGLFNQSPGPVVQVFNTGATHFAPTELTGTLQNGMPAGGLAPAFRGVATAFLVGALLGDSDARALFLGPAPQIQQVTGFEMNRFKGTSDPNLVVRTDPNAFTNACASDPVCSKAVQDQLFQLACNASPECQAAVRQQLMVAQLAAFVQACNGDATCTGAVAQACSTDPACTAAVVAALLKGGS